jgi:hypothetical protein
MKDMQTLQNHKCNDDGRAFKKFSGEVFYFNNRIEAEKWYLLHYHEIQSGSVACSICAFLIDRTEKRNWI